MATMDLDPSLVEELQELSLERPAQSVKSPEELERLTVDEDLGDIERAVYLLSSGQEVQRISVINNLPDLLQDHHDDCMRRVVPKVREVLHVAQAEMQVEACKAFLYILQGNMVPLHNYATSFLQSILMAIDSKDPDVANAWLETLLDVIELLPKEVIKRDILSLAIAKGQLSQSVQSRLACCRILGKIATKFEPFLIKKDILPLVQSLCQDVDYEVRGCMCRQLDPVARGLGLEATKNTILLELVELANDEESYVRLAGLETVVNLLSLLDDETCSNTIVPLVCKFCQQAMGTEDMTLPHVAKHIGKLCHGMSGNLTEEQRHWFISYFRKLCRIGLMKPGHLQSEQDHHRDKPQMTVLNSEGDEEDQSVECRKQAAYNFPAMVLFCGVRHFKSELYPTFSDMCSDPNHHIRRTLACGLHEVVKLLGNNGCLLQAELLVLLRDDSTEVLQGVVSYLPETLETMARGMGLHVVDAKGPQMPELVPALLQCEAVISSSNNWRLHAEFVHKLSSTTSIFTSDQIYHKFIPLLFSKLHTARALPVKHAVIRTLLYFLKHMKKQEHRHEMCRRLVDDICHADSCYRRMLFVDISTTTMELFSRNFFKQHFFEAILELATDPVPNIRLRICPLLPKLKRHIKLPSDRQLLQALETSVRKLLLNEKDADVMNAITKAVEELDRTQVQMESLTKKAFLEEDIADQKKEEEERKQLEAEEKEKKDEEGKSGKGEKRDKSGKRDGNASASKIPGPKRGSKIPTATMSSGKEKREKSNGNLTASKEKLSSSSREKATTKASRSKLPSSPRSQRNPASSSSSSRKGSASSISSTSSISSLSSIASSGSSTTASLRRGSTGSSEVRARREKSNHNTESTVTYRKKSYPHS